jgi:hypothetical protein
LAKNIKRKRVVKKLDEVVSKYIRLRDKKCVQCGKAEKLSNGHVFSRRAYNTRWDVSEDGNCHTQCWGCNFSHGKDNYDYYRWYVDKFGQDRFDELRREFKKSVKYTTAELEELYEKLKETYEELLNENKVN